MVGQHASFTQCELPPGKHWAKVGGCKHTSAENMTRAEFGRLPLVRCNQPTCRRALGRVCPDCQAVY